MKLSRSISCQNVGNMTYRFSVEISPTQFVYRVQYTLDSMMMAVNFLLKGFPDFLIFFPTFYLNGFVVIMDWKRKILLY